METRNQFISLSRILLVGLAVSFPAIAQAEFGIISSKQSTEPYGNAQDESFHRAIIGGGEMTAEEKEEVGMLFPEPLENRFYVRGGLDWASIKLSSFKNKSTGNNAVGTIAKKKRDKDVMGPEFAFGYAWTSLRTDVEWLLNEKVDYNANPVLNGVAAPQRLNGSVSNHTLLANLYWDFNELFMFRPYVVAGLGMGVNKTEGSLILNATGASQGAETYTSYGLAWNFGAGLQYNFWRTFTVYGSVRYTYLGDYKWKPIKSSSDFHLEGKNTLVGLVVGLAYYI